MEDTLFRGLGRLYLDATDSPWIKSTQGMVSAGNLSFQGLWRDKEYIRRTLFGQLNMIGTLMSDTNTDAYLVYLGQVRRGSSLGTWPLFLGLVALGARKSEAWQRLGICTWEGPCMIWPRWHNINAMLG